MAKKARRYHLKRTVVIGVFWEEERWAPRALKPAGWRARIESGGPRSFAHMTYEGQSRADAFWGFIRWMQADGYSGVARVKDL